MPTSQHTGIPEDMECRGGCFHISRMHKQRSELRVLVSVSLSLFSYTQVLWNACEHDRPWIVRLLLERGADPCLRSRDGCTPLMEAGWRGYTNVVACLLTHPHAHAVRISKTLISLEGRLPYHP